MKPEYHDTDPCKIIHCPVLDNPIDMCQIMRCPYRWRREAIERHRREEWERRHDEMFRESDEPDEKCTDHYTNGK